MCINIYYAYTYDVNMITKIIIKSSYLKYMILVDNITNKSNH